MKLVVAIRYIDALFFTKKNIKDMGLKTYIALGHPAVSKNHTIISFTREGGFPIRGLLIPNETLVLEKQKILKKLDIPKSQSRGGCDTGVFWKDMVYFENGKIPNQFAQMYTEGKFFSQTSDAIVIKNPETIEIKKGNIDNYPKVKTTFFIIPRALITGIELYGKKI